MHVLTMYITFFRYVVKAPTIASKCVRVKYLPSFEPSAYKRILLWWGENGVFTEIDIIIKNFDFGL